MNFWKVVWYQLKMKIYSNRVKRYAIKSNRAVNKMNEINQKVHEMIFKENKKRRWVWQTHKSLLEK